MGRVAAVFKWNVIDPDATVSVFIHPYAPDEFAGFCIVPALHSNVPPAAVQVKAQMTLGETTKHVDGIAHTVFVTNRSVGPQPYIEATLLEFSQRAT